MEPRAICPPPPMCRPPSTLAHTNMRDESTRDEERARTTLPHVGEPYTLEGAQGAGWDYKPAGAPSYIIPTRHKRRLAQSDPSLTIERSPSILPIVVTEAHPPSSPVLFHRP